MSAEERLVLHQLESEVEAELRIVQSGHAGESPVLSQAEWLFDPSDVERYRTGLYGLLGAVKALESDPEPHHIMRGQEPTP
jgi:hypothetical protein